MNLPPIGKEDKKTTKGDDKRQLIFDKYKTHLNIIVDNGFLKTDKEVYVCPICLRSHSNLDSEDPLTLEDAPPKSLGGRANILTCKSCNNTCGYKIDFHLTERLREIDSQKFIPNTETPVKIKINGDTLNGKIIVEKDGTLKIFHSDKNNHPEKLKKAMESLKGGMKIDMNFLKSRVIPENLEYALLKSGYLLFFEKFGYTILFEDCFDRVRKQLLNPEERIYPEGFWLTPPYPKEMSGVYFICDEGLESLLVLFNVDTGNTQRMFGTILPLPIHDLEYIVSKLNEKLEFEKQFQLTLYPLEQSKMDYLNNVSEIKAMIEWISKRRN